MSIFDARDHQYEEEQKDVDEEEGTFDGVLTPNRSFARRNQSIAYEPHESSLLSLPKEGKLSTIYEKNKSPHKRSGDINNQSHVLMTQKYMEEMSIPRPRE